MSVKSDKNLVTIATLKALKEKGDKFSCLTAYESNFSKKIKSIWGRSNTCLVTA
jgi:hypothetical protein